MLVKPFYYIVFSSLDLGKAECVIHYSTPTFMLTSPRRLFRRGEWDPAGVATNYLRKFTYLEGNENGS